MKMKNDILEVQKKEIDSMLKMFLKQYRYFNNNKLPKKIVFANVPNLELTEDFWEGHKGKEIPISYKGGAGAASRPLRASRANKPAPAERGSGSGESESAGHV